MNGFLNIYESSRVESQLTGYFNDPCYSILQVDGDYIPAWFFELIQGSVERMYLQELDINQLRNGTITVATETAIGTYTFGYGNGRYYGEKVAQTLTGLCRLKIDVDGTFYYSDLFKNLNDDIPVYMLEYREEGILLYSY